MSLNSLLERPPFELDRLAKEALLLSGLRELTYHHRAACEPYRRMTDVIFGNAENPFGLSDLPWLPVRLFKRMDLVSAPRAKIVRKLVSSGTTGQVVSRIYLDAETAALQTRALARIVTEFLGRQRLPMVIADEPSFLKNRQSFNARAAGIMGFSTFGRDHHYMFDERFQPNWAVLERYLGRYASSPILVFGFTFIIWQHLIEPARSAGVRLRFPADSVLIHGGGWKRLADRQIGNEQFKAALAETFGIMRIHNYYGMVEQVGSIFFECEHGYLHPPFFADVLIRDPTTLEVMPPGTQGLAQVLSLLPRSYPGHSLLTEDLATIHGEDNCPCGRNGKYLTVSGRLNNAEVRGCSDARTMPVP